jgi:glycosyltransferase involved in cell wall biosynthesis
MKLSIIIPAHNEEENIADVITKVEATVAIEHELVVVNDHSVDKTGQIVAGLAGEYKNIRLVENKREKGFANAIRAGFEACGGDVVIPVMGDLCDDLSTIPLLWDKIDQGFDVACGCRYTKEGGRFGGSRFKAILSGFAGCSMYYLIGIPTHDISNAFKMYRKKVIHSVEIKAKGFEISMELTLKAFFQGFKIGEVPTVWKERTKGKSSFKVFKLLPAYIRLYLWAIFRSIRG